MTEEKRIQNKILSYLNKLKKEGYPIFYERRQSGGFSYKKGIPDIYVVYDGKHIEIEVKKKGGKLSTMQEKFRDMCIEKNIGWLVVDDIETLYKYMKNLTNPS